MGPEAEQVSEPFEKVAQRHATPLIVCALIGRNSLVLEDWVSAK